MTLLVVGASGLLGGNVVAERELCQPVRVRLIADRGDADAANRVERSSMADLDAVESAPVP